MGTITRGKRRDLTEADLDKPEWGFDPGDYGKGPGDIWYCRPPASNAGIGSLRSHQITEHIDGTITVSPSIGYNMGSANPTHPQWHGYLERGVWREV